MFWILGVMFCGVGIGYVLRGRAAVKSRVERLVMPVIYLLLMAMGVTVGANEQVMQNLSTVGREALLITLGAVLGSVLAALGVYKLFFKKGTDEK